MEEDIVYLGSYSDMAYNEIQEGMDDEESFMFNLLETDMYLDELTVVW